MPKHPQIGCAQAPLSLINFQISWHLNNLSRGTVKKKLQGKPILGFIITAKSLHQWFHLPRYCTKHKHLKPVSLKALTYEANI